MANWAGVLTTHHARLVAAGLLVTPNVTSIARGEPKTLARVPHIGYWWGGRRPSSTGGNSFAKVNVEEALVTEIYLPDGIRLPNQMPTIEDYLRVIVDAIHGQLWGGVTLAGNAIGLEVGDTVAAWAEVSGITARTAQFTTWVDLDWVHDIAL